MKSILSKVSAIEYNILSIFNFPVQNSMHEFPVDGLFSIQS